MFERTELYSCLCDPLRDLSIVVNKLILQPNVQNSTLDNSFGKAD